MTHVVFGGQQTPEDMLRGLLVLTPCEGQQQHSLSTILSSDLSSNTVRGTLDAAAGPGGPRRAYRMLRGLPATPVTNL
jgi:hypothetical protein